MASEEPRVNPGQLGLLGNVEDQERTVFKGPPVRGEPMGKMGATVRRARTGNQDVMAVTAAVA